jgi:vacuolar-type H+-ATPase subunit H
MTHSDEAAGTARAEDAINRVLEAEQRARDKVAQCDAQAAALVAAAREGALRVAERTDRRIVSLRTRCEQWLGEQVAVLRTQAEVVRRQPVGDDLRGTSLAESVARLAARLTDGES